MEQTEHIELFNLEVLVVFLLLLIMRDALGEHGTFVLYLLGIGNPNGVKEVTRIMSATCWILTVLTYFNMGGFNSARELSQI